MAFHYFNPDMQIIIPQFSLLNTDTNLNFHNQFPEQNYLNTTSLEMSNFNFHKHSDEHIFNQIPEFPIGLIENFQQDMFNLSVPARNDINESKKRKTIETPESSSAYSSPAVSSRRKTITSQDKAAQTEKEITIEEILKAMNLLWTKVENIDKELQQIKSRQHDYKTAKLNRSEDLKIPELQGDVGKKPKNP